MKYNLKCILCIPLQRNRLEFFELVLDFFHVWFSMDVGFHLSDRNKGWRVSGWWERFYFCCSVLFLWSGGNTTVLFFFFFLKLLWSALKVRPPFLPRVITPHMNDWWWGARAPTHKKVSVKPLLLLVNVSPAYHALNRLLSVIYGYFSINT